VTRPSVGRHSVEAAGSTVEAYPAAGPTSSLSRPLGNRPDRHQPAPAGAVPRAPMTPEDYGSALADVTEQPGVVLPAAGWRRAVRAATFGLLQPGAAAAMDAERRLVARARTRRREPRMVAFVAGKGGVGTTTTALGVALTLAALRTDLTAVVDARHGAGSLGRRLAGRTAPTVAQLTEHRGPQPPLEPMRLYGSLGVVDGLPWYGPPPGGQLVQLLDHLREQFTFTLTDVGNDVGGAGQSVLGRADQVVVVTTPSHDAAAAANTALGRVYQVDPYRLTSVTIAVVCVSARQYRRAARSLRDELGLERNRIVPVPYDPQLAAGSAVEPKLLRPATREAYLRIAGFLADPGPADLGVLRRTGQGTAALPTVGGAATPAFPAVGAVADR
jgi:MinD-like ATPase involved in chromosome partitioning or flagellar assembly